MEMLVSGVIVIISTGLKCTLGIYNVLWVHKICLLMFLILLGACCPSGVKLYRLGNNGIRVYWRASDETINYNTDLHGSKGNFTCTPSSGLSHCDITEIPCGDVYTVVVSPVTDKGPNLTFCPKKIYSGKT